MNVEFKPLHTPTTENENSVFEVICDKGCKINDFIEFILEKSKSGTSCQ